jgi:hypothetical protein
MANRHEQGELPFLGPALKEIAEREAERKRYEEAERLRQEQERLNPTRYQLEKPRKTWEEEFIDSSQEFFEKKGEYKKEIRKVLGEDHCFHWWETVPIEYPLNEQSVKISAKAMRESPFDTEGEIYRVAFYAIGPELDSPQRELFFINRKKGRNWQGELFSEGGRMAEQLRDYLDKNLPDLK